MTTFVCGHRNPDTDSIVAAISYAALNNMLGENDYVPARLGHLNDETAFLLERFGFEPPLKITSVRTQVRDVEFDTPPRLAAGLPVSYAWNLMQKYPNLSVLPITNEDDTLYGLVAAGTIAQNDMQAIQTPVLRDAPILNVLSALEGHILNREDDAFDSLSGEGRSGGEVQGHRIGNLPDRDPAGRVAGSPAAVPGHAGGPDCPAGGPEGVPSGRLPGRRAGGRAAEPLPQLSDSGRAGQGGRHAEPVPPAAAAAEADRAGGPQRTGAERGRAGPGGTGGDY